MIKYVNVPMKLGIVLVIRLTCRFSTVKFIIVRILEKMGPVIVLTERSSSLRELIPQATEILPYSLLFDR